METVKHTYHIFHCDQNFRFIQKIEKQRKKFSVLSYKHKWTPTAASALYRFPDIGFIGVVYMIHYAI